MEQSQENVLLWSADSGKFLNRFKTSAGVNCMAFSPDGRSLAVAGMDRSLRIWEMVSGQARQTLQTEDEVMSLAYSPDGKLFATAKNRTITRRSSDGTTGIAEIGKPEPARVHLWNLDAEKALSRMEGHQGAITSLTFSPDGKLLATASNDTTVLLWDAARFKSNPPAEVQLRPEQLQSLWNDLAAADAVKSYRAIRTMAAASRSSTAFLKEQLHPVAPADANLVARLLADLDGDQFAVRDKAMQDLERLGDRAATGLRKALDAKPTLEVKRRIEQLLEKQNGVGNIRMVRALEILERIGTTEARKLCEALADGVPDAPLTREARAMLKRLSR
jgi:dipeptidyl aminopeptidase/acylaminoacyl peptidase